MGIFGSNLDDICRPDTNMTPITPPRDTKVYGSFDENWLRMSMPRAPTDMRSPDFLGSFPLRIRT